MDDWFFGEEKVTKFNNIIQEVFKERLFKERISIEDKLAVLVDQNRMLSQKSIFTTH